MKKSLLQKTFIHLILIVILGFIAYSNTFHASFHFDDDSVIIENPIIRDLHYFTDPSKAKPFTGLFEYHSFKMRYIGYLTFALNYKFHGLNVTGYHIVNLFFHIGTSLLLYLLVILTFRTPMLRASHLKDYAPHIAVFTALLFVCHPLQTQAVTYIWQRVTSLTSLFSVLSLVAYVKWRLSMVRGTAGTKALPWYVLSLLSVVLAMKTKETAFMFPVTITLYEFLFFEGSSKRRILGLVPLILTMLIIPLTLLDIDRPLGELVDHAGEEIRGSSSLSRWHYLLVEFRVIVTYLRLIFFPVNQNLDYDYPRYLSLWEPQVLLSFLFLVSLAGMSVFVLYYYRRTASHSRLISFGIFWFFINIALESSVIPLNNVIFEHRMYLPSVGIFLMISNGAFMVAKGLRERWRGVERSVAWALVFVVAALTVATHARNGVWKDEITLWQDVVNKSPNKPRGYNSLCRAYDNKKLPSKATEQCRIAIQLDPGYAKAYNNLGMAYASQGFIDKAIEQYNTALKIVPEYAIAYNNLGVAYMHKGLTDLAIQQYQTALALKPYLPEAHNNLGTAYMAHGFIDMAIEYYRTALSINPSCADCHYNLGVAYVKSVMYREAIKEFKESLKIKPGYVDAYINLGVSYFNLKKYKETVEAIKQAMSINPNDAEAHYLLGLTYKALEDKESTMKEYNILKDLNQELAKKLLKE